ncbi:MAG: OmpH family outer membrane protein [Bacteroidales bacterium]|nr:OmpH family outer membrane protein [Bacteroidales bacterium]
MKRLASVLIIAMCMTLGITKVQAQGNQKIAYIDTEYILQNIPEYSDAQEEINQMSTSWAKELKKLQNKIDQMVREYQTESVLLSDDMKVKKETAIAEKEQELANLQMQYFGPEGELFSKKVELIQPIQEKVYNAIQQVAQVKNYAFVLDKAAGNTILYCNEKFDISDDVLDEIGNVMQTVRRQDRQRNNNVNNAASASGNSKSGGSQRAPRGGDEEKK